MAVVGVGASVLDAGGVMAVVMGAAGFEPGAGRKTATGALGVGVEAAGADGADGGGRLGGGLTLGVGADAEGVDTAAGGITGGVAGRGGAFAICLVGGLM